MKVYGIRTEVTAGKNRPYQNVYIEVFHKSVKANNISQHHSRFSNKKTIRLSASSLMITTGTAAFIIKLHDNEEVPWRDKWR